MVMMTRNTKMKNKSIKKKTNKKNNKKIIYKIN